MEERNVLNLGILDIYKEVLYTCTWVSSILATNWLFANIVDEVILGTHIMNAYGFVVDLRENVLKVGQEKIKLCMAKMTGSTNLSLIHI